MTDWTVIIGRLFVFLTQEILGAGRLLPVPEDDLTSTISEIFLRGVTGSARESGGC
jgi:hypothetical protein